jgi:hypothetical protein
MAEKTVITFKFLRPGGFSISGFGNFTPELKMVLATADNCPTPPPKSFGNVWVHGYDYDQTYEIKLPTEEPRQLPPHIAKSKDETVRTAYHIKQAEIAAHQHEQNNHVRDELVRLERIGMIKVVGDTFMDKQHEDEPDKADPVSVAIEAEVPTAEVAASVAKRGRPPAAK